MTLPPPDGYQMYPPPERPDPLPDPTHVDEHTPNTTAEQLLLIITILVMLAIAPAVVIAAWKALL